MSDGKIMAEKFSEKIINIHGNLYNFNKFKKGSRISCLKIR